MDRDFLSEETLRYWCRRIRATEELTNVLVEKASGIKADGQLVSIFLSEQQAHGPENKWHQGPGNLLMDEYVIAKMPEPSLFYYLSYLSALPWVYDRYAERSIPEEIFDATMANLPTLIMRKYENTGRWSFSHFTWVWRYLACELFRLGRMNYQVIQYPGKAMAFKNLTDGNITVLCSNDMPLRADGYANGAGGRHDAEPWYAVYEETKHYWRGNPINRQGFVLREKVTLPKSEWVPALMPGDLVLDVHIPWYDRFEPQDCRKSIAMAEQFFSKYYPEKPFKGFFCHTWMFTAQLDSFLPDDSNIIRFKREFHLLPYPGSGDGLWRFVFPESCTPDNAPCNTKLRRAVLDHIKNGGELFDLQGIALQGSRGWGSSYDS